MRSLTAKRTCCLTSCSAAVVNSSTLGSTRSSSSNNSLRRRLAQGPKANFSNSARPFWLNSFDPRRRQPALLELGVRPRLARDTACGHRGPRYLAQAKALSVGLSNAYSNRSDFRPYTRRASATISNRRSGPYARWCGRGWWATAAPMPIKRGYRRSGF